MTKQEILNRVNREEVQEIAIRVISEALSISTDQIKMDHMLMQEPLNAKPVKIQEINSKLARALEVDELDANEMSGLFRLFGRHATVRVVVDVAVAQVVLGRWMQFLRETIPT